MPWVVKGEGLRPVQWLGLAIAFAGVALAFAEGFSQPAAGPLQWLGDAMGLAAAVLWGLTTLSIRASRLSQAAPEKTLFYQLVVSFVWLGLGALAAGEAWPRQWSAGTLGSLGFQTVVITFASYLVWFWLVRHYAAAPLASYTLLTPVAGLVAGVVLLDEPATPRLLLALVAVAWGLWWVQRPAAAKAAPPTPSFPPSSSSGAS
jgi:drug/metabolite transporter (DMT)-like permease